MKEFIEKLIGRLEESQERYDDVAFAEMNENGQTLDFECAHGKRDGVSEAISIVNQLAEEYRQDLDKNSQGWILCSEKMPLFIDNVLVCTKSGGRTIACLTTGKRFCDMYMNIIDNVVAWMPLPPAYVPKEGRE